MYDADWFPRNFFALLSCGNKLWVCCRRKISSNEMKFFLAYAGFGRRGGGEGKRRKAVVITFQLATAITRSTRVLCLALAIRFTFGWRDERKLRRRCSAITPTLKSSHEDCKRSLIFARTNGNRRKWRNNQVTYSSRQRK